MINKCIRYFIIVVLFLAGTEIHSIEKKDFLTFEIVNTESGKEVNYYSNANTLIRKDIYDFNNNLISYSEYNYDQNGKLDSENQYFLRTTGDINRTINLNSITKKEYNAFNNVIKAFYFDKHNHLTGYSTYKYNKNNLLVRSNNFGEDNKLKSYIKYFYNKNGNKKEEKHYNNQHISNYLTRYFYSKGNLEKKLTYYNNLLSNYTRYFYDKSGNLLTRKHFNTYKVLTSKTELEYAGSTDKISSETFFGKDGRITQYIRYIYDGEKQYRLTFSVRGNNKLINDITENVFNDNGNLLQTIRHDITLKPMNKTVYEYDSQGNQITIKYYSDNMSYKKRVYYRYYNGNRLKSTVYYYDDKGRSNKSEYYNYGHLTSYTTYEYLKDSLVSTRQQYDADNKLISRTENIYNNNNRLVKSITENFKYSQTKTATFYDTKGKNYRSETYRNNVLTEYRLYKYDDNKILEQITFDSNKNELYRYKYIYNHFGKTEIYFYYKYGNLNTSTEYTYNKYGKLIQTISFDRNGTEKSKSTYEYDKYGNTSKVAYFYNGKLNSITIYKDNLNYKNFYYSNGVLSYVMVYNYNNENYLIKTEKWDSEEKELLEYTEYKYNSFNQQISYETFDSKGNSIYLSKTYYNDHGQTKQNEYYTNGKLSYTYYYKDNKMYKYENYRNNEIDSTTLYYYNSDGKQIKREQFKNNKLENIYKYYYDKFGNQYKQETIDSNGNIISKYINYYSNTGKLQRRVYFRNELISSETFYNEQQQTEKTRNYDKDGNIEYEYLYFYDDNNKTSHTETYKNGELNSYNIYFYDKKQWGDIERYTFGSFLGGLFGIKKDVGETEEYVKKYQKKALDFISKYKRDGHKVLQHYDSWVFDIDKKYGKKAIKSLAKYFPDKQSFYSTIEKYGIKALYADMYSTGKPSGTPKIKVSITTDKKVYYPGETIQLTFLAENNGDGSCFRITGASKNSFAGKQLLVYIGKVERKSKTIQTLSIKVPGNMTNGKKRLIFEFNEMNSNKPPSKSITIIIK